MTTMNEMLFAIRKLQLALEYAKNHAMNPANTIEADLFADIDEALALAERITPLNDGYPIGWRIVD